MSRLFAQMGPCHIRPLWLRSSADNESHYRHYVPIDEVRWWTHKTPWGWGWHSQLAKQYCDDSIHEM